MKYFTKNLSILEKKTFILKENTFPYYLLYFLGIWTERFDYKTKVKNFSMKL